MRYLRIVFLIIFSSTFIAVHAQEEEEESAYKPAGSCGGVERWSIKVIVDTDSNKINFTPISSTVYSLITLTTPTPSTTMPRYIGVEDKTYTITCNITQKRFEDDNDYHLVLSDGTHTLIGEVPDPVCSAAATSPHVNQYISARNFVDTHIASGNVYTVSLPPVTVTGVAFIDPPHGATGAAPNNIELHPILDIHFASTAVTNVPRLLSVDIVPNPFAGRFVVKVSSKSGKLNNCSIQLYNVLAQKIVDHELHPTDHTQINETVDLPQLPQGVYIYRLLNDGQLIYDGKMITE